MSLNSPEKQVEYYKELIDFIQLYKLQKKHPLRKYFKGLKSCGLCSFEIMYILCFYSEADVMLLCKHESRGHNTNCNLRDRINLRFDKKYHKLNELDKTSSFSCLVDKLNLCVYEIENEVLIRYVLDKEQKQIVKVIHCRRKELPQIQAVYNEKPWAKLLETRFDYLFSNNCDFYATDSLRENTQQKDA